MSFTVHEVHGLVAASLPKKAAMRGFIHALETVLGKIRERGRWPFFQKEGAITFVASYATGTVTCTNGSQTVTGSGTTFTSDMVGRRFRAAGNELYTVSGWTSGTQIAITPAYVGSTAAGLSYSIVKDRYALPSDCERLLEWWDATNQQYVKAVSSVELGNWANVANVTGTWPVMGAQFGWEGDGPLVMFYPAPTVAALIPIWYYRAPALADSPGDTIDLPTFMRPIVVQGVRWLMLEQMMIDGLRLESGVLEQQRNRFYSEIEARWTIESARMGNERIEIVRGDDRFHAGDYPYAPMLRGPVS